MRLVRCPAAQACRPQHSINININVIVLFMFCLSQDGLSSVEAGSGVLSGALFR